MTKKFRHSVVAKITLSKCINIALSDSMMKSLGGRELAHKKVDEILADILPFASDWDSLHDYRDHVEFDSIYKYENYVLGCLAKHLNPVDPVHDIRVRID
jgi:hypothetical protein